MRKLIVRLIGFMGFLFACVIIGGAVLLLSTGIVDLERIFPRVAELPEIDTKGLPKITVPGAPELPSLPERPANENAPEGTVILEREVKRRPIVAAIPAPQQVVTAPRVIISNAFLAILMALVFGGTSTVMGNMLRDEEPRIQAWLKAFGIDKPLRWIKDAFQWTLRGRVRQGCLTLPLIALILALYGIIFAFLEEGTSIFSREGVFLSVAFSFSVGLVSFSGDIARRVLARIWRQDSKFNLYPANLFVAILTVIMSRVLNFSPGLAFGTPGGADVDMPERDAAQKRREVILSFTTLGMIALFTVVGWAASGAMLKILHTPIRAEIAEPLAGVVTPLQNTSLLLFLVAIETLFFESLPLSYGTGRTIYEWNKFAWSLIFIPIAFVFNHTLLNPQSGFLESFLTPNVRLLWFVIFALIGVTGTLWFYFNVVDDILRDWAGVRLSN